MSITIQLRRGTAAAWAAANTLLAIGEVGLETDTDKFKIGDGQALWSARPYAGLVGPQGVAGPTGPQGLPGATGATGSAGQTGATGQSGPTGLTGPTGSPGQAGATGQPGPTGPAGPTGSTGPQGATGPAGATGSQGPQGAAGIQGPAGNDGAQGPQGMPGTPGLGGPATCRAVADTANSSSTAPSNIAGLAFAVSAGVTYAFEFRVVVQSAALTTGIGLSVTFPAATVFAASAEIPNAADAASAAWFGWITASDDLVVGTGVPAITTSYLAIIRGQITPSANGTLQARIRSEVNASAVTAKAGSCGILQTIP